MVGFGSEIFNQGTFGKGVMHGHTDLDATSTVKSFGIAQWEAQHSLVYSSSLAKSFGGLIQGAKGFMQGTSTMYSYPNFTWAGFDIITDQSTVKTFGYIAWDGQNVSDSTWTTQEVE